MSADTTDTAALLALASRVEAGEISRDIDREVMAQFYRWGRRHIGVREDPGDRPVTTWVWIDPATDKWVTSAGNGYEFTTSLDDVTALYERVGRRGRQLNVRQYFTSGQRCVCVEWIDHGGVIIRSEAPTEPAARLAVLLRAVAANKEASNAGN